MPELVERAGVACLRAVVVPALLHRLLAQRTSAHVLLCAEERPVLVAHPFEVGTQLMHQARIVEQNGSPLATLLHDGQVFVTEREVKFLYILRDQIPTLKMVSFCHYS